MDREELQQTDIWTLFQQGQDYARMIDIFNKTDLNFRMFNGDQNEGLIVEGIEKLELNYIKPIVRYKVGVVISNNWAINYSSENESILQLPAHNVPIHIKLHKFVFLYFIQNS